MRVLVACEESQTVTKAFRRHGHEAFSADIQPPSKDRGKLRSKFPHAIAEAMAKQWGNGHVPRFRNGLFMETTNENRQKQV